MSEKLIGRFALLELLLIDYLVDRILAVVDRLERLRPKTHKLEDAKFMFIIKADNPDVNYSLSFQATDSEGNPVAAEDLDVSVTSDNETAVSVAPATSTGGTVHFGAPGFANLNAVVKNKAGTLLGSFGAQFTVTSGDPSAITGGQFAFEGLTEAPAPEPD